MAGQDGSAKDSEMAAHLIRQGYPHGKRKTRGLTNIPDLKDVGSAAYRRRMAKMGRPEKARKSRGGQ